MPLVRFDVAFDPRNPRMLPCDARAVLVGPYAQVEEEAGHPGGIVRGDIEGRDIQCLGEFEEGSDLYVEGDPDDVLDDADDETARTGRIWWRATIVER